MTKKHIIFKGVAMAPNFIVCSSNTLKSEKRIYGAINQLEYVNTEISIKIKL